jgi:RNA polymerase sigma factor (sigma-70 family)
VPLEDKAPSLAGAAYEQHRAVLHRFLMRRLHNDQNAQDLAQEVYLRLLRVEDREVIRDPLAFLYRLAMNLVYEFRLRRQRDPVLFDSEAAEEVAERSLGASSGDLSEPLCTDEELKRVLSALPAMPRAVFVLRKRDGMSDREIATELGLSVHTVKKYLCQAVAQCREAVKNHGMGAG